MEVKKTIRPNTIIYEKLFTLPNYQHHKIGISATVDSYENLGEAFLHLRKIVEGIHIQFRLLDIFQGAKFDFHGELIETQRSIRQKKVEIKEKEKQIKTLKQEKILPIQEKIKEGKIGTTDPKYIEAVLELKSLENALQYDIKLVTEDTHRAEELKERIETINKAMEKIKKALTENRVILPIKIPLNKHIGPMEALNLAKKILDT